MAVCAVLLINDSFSQSLVHFYVDIIFYMFLISFLKDSFLSLKVIYFSSRLCLGACVRFCTWCAIRNSQKQEEGARSQKQSYRRLWAITWVPATKLLSSSRILNALNPWAISQAPIFNFCILVWSCIGMWTWVQVPTDARSCVPPAVYTKNWAQGIWKRTACF